MSKGIKAIIIFSIISFFINIVISIYQIELMDTLTVFIYPLISLGARLSFLILFVWSIIHCILKKRWKDYNNYYPLGINVIVLVAYLFIPFTTIALDINYNRYKDERNIVVSKILSGELTSNKSIMKLPENHKNTSVGGGDIHISNEENDTKILFYTFRGILDNYSGFLYSKNDLEPDNRTFGGDIKQVVKYDNHWYFIALW